ncbi:MAG: LLM class flavin-dependent oxidoreductase [Pseudonocardia sp.]|uniref:LLM class flavin-dependent oxidoreductase n=1 Tax=unclassified Pseudonocardia TaxID=2619320 RepID=UPI00086A46ED|nr:MULTISPECIES: LLM class flavin-dependent oxidoreductase [unclassified Pseudonocardia]MBN9111995.1 LLM class flavin-dependent oxidoreductase [Pseudonocardia sp.]ODU25970.1 MAG: luciferase [Pseudonocardia sp. SCN 72-51]ODV06075.1 MAG: luciferase [Pseudonocardia sp. SCN 73-27]
MKAISDGKDFKLGLFSANCSSGLAVTRIPERWSASWADNLRLAQLADEVGIDFLLPIARWIGYGGDTNFHESVLDPTSLAAALLARTDRITVFSTVHAAFNHPVVAAKALATVDQIGQGRAGINIVAGWNEPEYRAMGLDLPTDHDDRYALAQEWWDVIRRIWTTDGSFDHDGRFFQLQGVEGMPEPFDGPLPVLNAGSSGQGRGFAARNADFAFTIVGGPEDGADVVRTVTAAAEQDHGRSVGVFTLGHVVCRPTRAEAEDYLRYYADENADWAAVDNLMRLQGLHAQSFTPEMLETFRNRFAAGHGSCPLVGDPDDVADGIAALHEAGFAGMTVSFVDYAGELGYFAQEVIPRLEARGVRVPR